MAQAKFNSILFNVSGIGALLFAGGYIVISAFTTERIESCTHRYPAGMQFALDGPSGAALTPNELQGMLGWRQWGITENAKVTGLSNAPGKKVLRVNLKDVKPDDGTIAKNGVGFFWPIEKVRTVRAACMSYRVYLPSDFKFEAAGRLPGLAGDSSGVDAMRPGDTASFAARVGWSPDGTVGTEVLTPDSVRTWRIGGKSHVWPRGKWVKVEQEIVLNTSGKSDGAVRLWLDGALIGDETGLSLRGNSNTGFAGVVSDIGLLGAVKTPPKLFISPPIVHWH